MQDLQYDASELGRETTVWIDLASPAHPYFFESLAEGIGLSCRTTVRQKTETVALAKSSSLDPTVLGTDFDNPYLRRLGIPLRATHLATHAPTADLSLSARNAMAILASKARGIPSIHFTDNDVTAYVDGLRAERLYNWLESKATHTIVPAAFDRSTFTEHGVPAHRIHSFDGYKEDVTVANFDPDPRFPEQLPVDEYVVIRPEALSAAYVDIDESIVPDLLATFVSHGYDIVYLPRGREDADYAASYDKTQVHVPSSALDGRQLAWHAQCVLTGSGTMAREAACMRKPAISFFPNIPLSVDQQLIADGRIYHSREPDRIVRYVEQLGSHEQAGSLEAARVVREEVIDLVSSLIRQVTVEQGGQYE